MNDAKNNLAKIRCHRCGHLQDITESLFCDKCGMRIASPTADSGYLKKKIVKKCRVCGRTQESGVLCDQCGVKLQEIPLYEVVKREEDDKYIRKCRRCGNIQKEGVLCERCGIRLMLIPKEDRPSPSDTNSAPHLVRRCRRCGRIYERGIFCERCGIRLDFYRKREGEDVEEGVYTACPRCGIRTSQPVCPVCGENITKVPETL